MTPPTSITDWHSYLQQIQPWEQQILTRVTNEHTKIWTQLLSPEENWIAVSDGSYSDNTGAFAWIIHDGKQMLQSGNGLVAGNPITPFRTELHGIVAIYCTLHHIMEYYDINTTTRLQVYTDNQKVLKYQHHIIEHSSIQISFFDDHDLYLSLIHI